ncbi:ABC-2 family transporter [Kineothrix alysoides]|uniref:ABC-2 family transporter n=1 Tax=Kineothrix alysoides TaxID=1469948 RepID=A0A4R1QR24_9FIRM|nr:ABC transporter permease [Kineothrix alysoides]TCL56296.1 ABC-2 family transporter [Kineothrix alysoides]
MRTLIKLELRRNKIQTYVTASLIITITMLCFLYLFAYAPMLEPNDKDMAIFSGYDNLIPLFEALNMAVFCVLSAVMYSKIIIEDYSGKRPVLLFSYPVSRKKIMLAKLSVVCVFTTLSMFLSNIIVFLIFGITEKFIHLVSGKFTLSIMLQVVETTLLMLLITAGAGIAAAGIGFIKKSVPTTIVSAVLIASLLCNVVANTTCSRMAMYIFAMVMLFIGMAFTIILIKSVDAMEVE